jgi:ketosteroid isomerase-like protein
VPSCCAGWIASTTPARPTSGPSSSFTRTPSAAFSSGGWRSYDERGWSRLHARYCAAISQENVDKTTDFLAAFNRGDFDAAVEFFDPEVEWVLPPQQWAESCRGPDEVKRFWEGLDETFDELRLDPQESMDAGDHVAVRLRFYGRGKASGAEIEEEMYHQVTTFRDGRMVRIEYFTDWASALEAAGLKE